MKKLLYLVTFLCIYGAAGAKNTSVATDNDRSIIRDFRYGDTQSKATIYYFETGAVEIFSKQNYKKSDSAFGVEYTFKGIIQNITQYASQAEQLAAIEHPGQYIQKADSTKYSLSHLLPLPLIGKTVFHEKVVLDKMGILDEETYSNYTESVSYMLIWSMLIVLLGPIINTPISAFIEKKRWYKKTYFKIISVGLYMVPGTELAWNASSSYKPSSLKDIALIQVEILCLMTIGVFIGIFLKNIIKRFLQKRENRSSLTLAR